MNSAMKSNFKVVFVKKSTCEFRKQYTRPTKKKKIQLKNALPKQRDRLSLPPRFAPPLMVQFCDLWQSKGPFGLSLFLLKLKTL